MSHSRHRPWRDGQVASHPRPRESHNTHPGNRHLLLRCSRKRPHQFHTNNQLPGRADSRNHCQDTSPPSRGRRPASLRLRDIEVFPRTRSVAAVRDSRTGWACLRPHTAAIYRGCAPGAGCAVESKPSRREDFSRRIPRRRDEVLHRTRDRLGRRAGLGEGRASGVDCVQVFFLAHPTRPGLTASPGLSCFMEAL